MSFDPFTKGLREEKIPEMFYLRRGLFEIEDFDWALNLIFLELFCDQGLSFVLR